MESGFCLIDDNAYVCSLNMLTPFTSNEVTNINRDAYNFYLSQLRIRIEISCVLLVGRWRIFDRPLLVSLDNVPRIVQAAARLHNFVQNHHYETKASYDIVDECIREGIIRRHGASLVSLLGYAPSTLTTEAAVNEFLRDAMIEKIKRRNLFRPA